MNKVTLTTLLLTVSLYGCSDGTGLTTAGTSPKQAAELCNGYAGVSAPSKSQAPIVSAYKAGVIDFNECMRRLRA